MEDNILNLLNQFLERQQRIEIKIDEIAEQTADLTKFRIEMKDFRNEAIIGKSDYSKLWR